MSVVTRIQFRKGSYTGSVDGSVGSGTTDFVLRARNAQTMTIDVGGDALFKVYAGQRDISGGSAYWSGTLPRDGDYHVRVYRDGNAVSAGAVDFTLNIEIR